MSTITTRSIARQGFNRSLNFPRDHFAMVGIKRSQCHGASFGARVLDVIFPGKAISYRHPTKKRTAGRICFFVKGAA